MSPQIPLAIVDSYVSISNQIYVRHSYGFYGFQVCVISQTSPNSENILIFSLHLNNLKVHSLISKQFSAFKVENFRVHVPSVSYNLIISLKVGVRLPQIP